MAVLPTQPLQRDEQPSVACPHCSAHTAEVKTVATNKDDNSTVNITMFCRDCKQTWMVQKLAHDEAPA